MTTYVTTLSLKYYSEICVYVFNRVCSHAKQNQLFTHIFFLSKCHEKCGSYRRTQNVPIFEFKIL